MQISILIGGKAGQGINKVAGIVSQALMNYGYYVFNYRDYQSLIRGGHNFNILSISDSLVSSCESKVDVIAPIDRNTIKIHKDELKDGGIILDSDKFFKYGMNINIALSGALIKILGLDKSFLLSEVKKQFSDKHSFSEGVDAANSGYDSQINIFKLKKLNNAIYSMTGSKAFAIGAIKSSIDLYIAYPMTPTTNALHELAARQIENKFMVFQPEGEIAGVNMALGASFAGARVAVGTSGGGFDLMAEALSLQGASQVPLTVYLGMRPGPATGLPTYNLQADLFTALRSGHGEFPRVVIAPGDPLEVSQKVNEAMYLSQKYNCLSIVMSDTLIAESEYSYDKKIEKFLPVKVTRSVPGETIIKVSSYETNQYGLTIEDPEQTVVNADERLERYEKIKKECKNFEMMKIHGKKSSKNLIVGWGSTTGAIIDAIKNEDFKFLQVIYMKPMSDSIKKEIESAKNVILVECNSTGQLGRLIREKTGIKIEKRILKYDGRPFRYDELKKELIKKIK